jgi:hypothetical protein
MGRFTYIYIYIYIYIVEYLLLHVDSFSHLKYQQFFPHVSSSILMDMFSLKWMFFHSHTLVLPDPPPPIDNLSTGHTVWPPLSDRLSIQSLSAFKKASAPIQLLVVRSLRITLNFKQPYKWTWTLFEKFGDHRTATRICRLTSTISFNIKLLIHT